MSVPYLKEAAAAGEMENLIRFVRLHLGDGNEQVRRKEIDKSWIETSRRWRCCISIWIFA
jgi:hypothetical protein